MAVKANWQNGEQFNASDQNAVAEAVNAAYVKPTGGVPITDLTASVQVSLGKADTAVQSVNAASITDSTTTGRAVITAVDAAAARTTLGVSYGSTAGTVVEGNDSRLSPSSTSITDSTATGRSLLTAVDPAAARTTLGVAYGTTSGTVAQGNDSRITGAEQAANKGVANGYASLDSGGKVPVAQLPNSIMEYQGTYNASTNSPSLVNGTGNNGDVYRVSVAGSRNFGAGAISFEVGDYVIYNGSVWEKSDTTDAVSTVAGLTGDVSASSLRGAIATGTPSSSTWLRGDGAWATLPASGITRSVQTITTPTTLGAAANTDYICFANVSAEEDSYSYATTLLHFNGSNGSTTFTDSASTPLTWTSYNGCSLTTSNKKFGTAALNCSGSNYITTPNTSATDFGSGNFTIECMFYTGTSSRLDIAGKYNNADGWGMALSITGTRTIDFYNGNSVFLSSSANAWSLNTWNHYAVVRNGNTVNAYINGTSVATASFSSSILTSGNASMFFGFAGGGGTPFNGQLDEFRILKGKAAYTANFTAPVTELPNSVIGSTITLPTAVGTTNLYTIVNTGTVAVALGTTNSQTINGAAPGSVASNAKLTVISDGSNWRSPW